MPSFLSSPKVIQCIIKYSGGLIKNEKQAYHFLLVFIILSFIISISLFSSSGSDTREDLKNSSPPAQAPVSFFKNDQKNWL